MAGSGPAPKPAAQRRRQNKVSEVELPAEGHTGPYPPLPAWRDWRPDTRAWYAEWCTSPMATEWLSVHFTRLHHIAVLYDDWLSTGSIDLVKEIRLQMAGFGGTPLDLRRMGRKVTPRAAGEVVKLPGRRPPRRLRAVDPAG